MNKKILKQYNISMEYKVCTKTIMDTSDPNIIFNENSESDYFVNYNTNILPNWHTDERG